MVTRELQLLIDRCADPAVDHPGPSGPLATIAGVDDADPTSLRIPAALRGRAPRDPRDL